MLRLENVIKSFGGKKAVDGVSLVVPAGQMVGVIGRSGAGKSTLLRMINRLGDPSSGRILFGDTDVTALRGRPLRAWRARCAMIFQQFNLAGRLDVLTNVLMGRINHIAMVPALLKAWPDDEKLRALRALDRLDLADLAGQRAESLSGGQQQRVAIARALVTKPPLVIADEPTANLDTKTAREVLNLFRTIVRERNTTLLMATHDTLAEEYVDRTVFLSDGLVVDALE